MIAISRRQVMQTMPGMLLSPFASAHAADTLTLKAAAAVCGVRFGASPETDLRTAPDAYLQLLASQCELLVPILPWSAARQPGEYHFDGAAATPRLRLRASHAAHRLPPAMARMDAGMVCRNCDGSRSGTSDATTYYRAHDPICRQGVFVERGQ